MLGTDGIEVMRQATELLAEELPNILAWWEERPRRVLLTWCPRERRHRPRMLANVSPPLPKPVELRLLPEVVSLELQGRFVEPQAQRVAQGLHAAWRRAVERRRTEVEKSFGEDPDARLNLIALALDLVGERAKTWRRDPILGQAFGIAAEVTERVEEFMPFTVTHEEVAQAVALDPVRELAVEVVVEPDANASRRARRPLKRLRAFLTEPELHVALDAAHHVRGGAPDSVLRGVRERAERIALSVPRFERYWAERRLDSIVTAVCNQRLTPRGDLLRRASAGEFTGPHDVNLAPQTREGTN